jgi:hypothetical protein
MATAMMPLKERWMLMKMKTDIGKYEVEWMIHVVQWHEALGGFLEEVTRTLTLN